MTATNNNIKAKCVICKIPLQNEKPEEEPYLFKCPKCHNTYFINYEIMAYEDDFSTAHEDEIATIEKCRARCWWSRIRDIR